MSATSMFSKHRVWRSYKQTPLVLEGRGRDRHRTHAHTTRAVVVLCSNLHPPPPRRRGEGEWKKRTLEREDSLLISVERDTRGKIHRGAGVGHDGGWVMNPVLHHCSISTSGQEGWQYSLKFNNSEFMSIKSLHPLSFHGKTMPLYTQWWCLRGLNMMGDQWTEAVAGPCEPNNVGYHCVRFTFYNEQDLPQSSSL